MYHTIEFTYEIMVDLQTSRKDRLEIILIPQGTRRCAQLKPYVIEGDDGPTEVADLFLDDGTALERVPFECFCFVEE